MTDDVLRVLIVDDDAVVATLHREFVAQLDGFAICGTADTGPSAVAAVERLTPDIVLLDMHLPGFSGIEVLRRIRISNQPQPEVIAVTAARDVDTVRDSRRAGVRHYLAKPFASGDLRARLREVGTELRDRRAPKPVLEQAQIDALMAPTTSRGDLPKGLSSHTLRVLIDELGASPGTTAAELGARTGVSRVTSRRYLEYLVAVGAAERTLDYSTSGRPKARYALRAQA